MPEGDTIPGSFWGEPEAGIVGTRIYLRSDTPVHSMLHESCHIVCMDPGVRASHNGNAGSDDLEEASVCYLQVLLAGHLGGVERTRLTANMDAWGYSFRLGSASRWFDEDADDARQWLFEHKIIDGDGVITWRLRML